VRVIAGIAKGRRLRAASGTRPTADSVKEALFSTLGPRVAGSRVLDLYAGSGALGIEALSRGAETATFVERDPRAVSAIRSNLEATGFSDQARVVEAPVHRFLASGHPPAPGPEAARGPVETAGTSDSRVFDLVLADPPYAEDPAGVLDLLSGSPLLAPNVLVALEVAGGNAPRDHGRGAGTREPGGSRDSGGSGVAGGLTVRSVRRYGDSAILYAGFAELAERAESGADAGGGGAG